MMINKRIYSIVFVLILLFTVSCAKTGSSTVVVEDDNHIDETVVDESNFEGTTQPQSTTADTTEESNDAEIDNLPTQIDVKPVEYSLDMDIGDEPLELAYASEDKIIIWGYIGLFEYDIKEETLSHTLDLGYIDCNHMQGDIHSEIEVSQDGNTAYIMRYGLSGEIEAMYSYDLLYDVLTKIQPTSIDDYFNNFADINELGLYSDASDDFTGMEVVDLGNGRYGYMRFYGWLLSDVRYETDNEEYVIFK